MLYSVPDMKRIETVPHGAEYKRWRDALDALDATAYGRICDDLASRFDTNEVNTSSWIPGGSWTGTVFDPIYYACGQDELAAGYFFGLLVWQVVLDHPECWSFGRYQKDGIEIRGMTYFRIDCP